MRPCDDSVAEQWILEPVTINYRKPPQTVELDEQHSMQEYRTMKWKAVALAGIVCLFASSSAEAVDWDKILCLDWYRPLCIQKTCCDDYCGKPVPCVPRVRCFECDDYRPKCEPCAKRICCFGCDDYCYKCPPVIRCPSCAHLKCVPTAGTSCACGKTSGPTDSCQER